MIGLWTSGSCWYTIIFAMLELTRRPRLRIDRKRKPIGMAQMSKQKGPREGGNVDGNRQVVLHSIFDDMYATFFSGDDEDQDNSTPGVIARSPSHMQTIDEGVETQ
jgi:hypothetical protein